MIKLFVLRHAQTDSDVQDRTLGTLDWPLNKMGLKEIKRFATKLKASKTKFDLIIASPLKRTFDSANIIGEALNVPVITDKLIIERNFGELQGLTWEEFCEKYPELIPGNEKYYQTNLPSAEPRESVVTRVKQFLQKIHANYDGKAILVVTSTGIIRIMKCELLGISPEESRKGLIPNLELIKFTLK